MKEIIRNLNIGIINNRYLM